jgi:hypothetical protein
MKHDASDRSFDDPASALYLVHLLLLSILSCTKKPKNTDEKKACNKNSYTRNQQTFAAANSYTRKKQIGRDNHRGGLQRKHTACHGYWAIHVPAICRPTVLKYEFYILNLKVNY